MKKSTLLTIVALVLALAMGVSGTMAYLSDTDDDVNVMTLGNVDIEQIELERVPQEGHEATNDAWVSTGETDKYGHTPDEMQDFNQSKPLYPAVFADGQIKWDDRTDGHEQSWQNVVSEAGNPAPGASKLFDDSVKNAVDKFVFVENTGKSDAYVRTVIAFEQGSLTSEGFDKVIATNGDTMHWNWETVATDVVIDGNEYVIAVATYMGPTTEPTGILAPGAVTYPSLLQVYMLPEATNEDCIAIDGNKNGAYDILVVSQAVQTAGFANAEAALEAAFGEISATNHPWMGEDPAPTSITFVDSADALVAALENNEDVLFTQDIKIDPANMSNAYGTTGINVKNGQLIDGNGHTLDIKGAGGTWDSGINTTGGTIRNLTVTGSFRGIFINHNSTHSEPVVLEKVKLDGVTYTISCDQGLNQTLIAKNCEFNGWTSFAATLGEATFNNCKFAEGNGYAYCRPYAPTKFVNCEFEAGYTLNPRAQIVLENCTLGGVKITAENVADLVTDTANVTVK